MSKLNNLSPDYYSTIIEKGGRLVEVIYSTLDDFMIVPPGTDTSKLPNAKVINATEGLSGKNLTKDLLIYADTLTIGGTIKMPGSNITIIARKVILPDNLDAGFDVTPEPIPPDPKILSTAARRYNLPPEGINDEKAKEINNEFGVFDKPKGISGRLVGIEMPIGKNKTSPITFSDMVYDPPYKGSNGIDSTVKGKDAGKIEIKTEELITNGKKLVLIAKGGKGQLGQGGMNGPAAEPGADGLGYFDKGENLQFVNSYYGYCEWAKEPIRNTNGGKGGDGGKGSTGGNGGQILLTIPESAKSSLLTDVIGGDPGEDGIPGAGTPGAPGVSVTVNYHWYTEMKGDQCKEVGKLKYNDGRQGPDGSLPNRKTDPGIGKPGKVDINPVNDVSLGNAFDSTYLLKLFQKAKNFYLYNPPFVGQSEQAKKDHRGYKIMNWIFNVLGSIDIQKNAEGLRKKQILKQITGLLMKFEKGRNIYGREENWVPRRALTAIEDDIQNMINPFKKLEEQFINAFKEQEATAQQELALRISQDSINQLNINTNNKIKVLNAELPKVVDLLDNYTTKLNDVRKKIRTILKEYENSVRSYWKCSLGNIFRALEMIAFDPKNVMMAGVQGGNLLYKSMSEINGVKKTYIIGEIENLEKEADGSLKLDPLISQLTAEQVEKNQAEKMKLWITDLTSFEKEMKKFAEALPNQGQGLRLATAELKSIVKNRGEALIEYNTLLSMLLEYQTELKTIATKKAEIESAMNNTSDPTQIGAVSYLAVIYQNMRDHVMELVYDASRALDFWSAGMSQPSTGYDKFKAQVLWVEGAFPSKISALDLEVTLRELKQQVADQQTAIGRNKMSFPSNAADEGNIKVRITEKEMLDAFRTNRSLTFRTVPGEAVGEEFKVENIENKFNIRATYVRPRLRFVKTAAQGVSNNDALKPEINVVHVGNDKLTNKKGILIDYQPKGEVSTIFTQVLTPKPNESDYLTDGNLPVEDNSIFASLALFAEWRIHLPDIAANQGLDLNNLNEIEIEFGCQAYPKDS